MMKPSGVLMAFALVIVLSAGRARADGKFYPRETAPPDIPYQRALVLYEEGEETLFLQSQYALSAGDRPETLGWVVPVPAAPELASMPAEEGQLPFEALSGASHFRVIRIRYVALVLLGLLYVGTAVLRVTRGKSVLPHVFLLPVLLLVGSFILWRTGTAGDAVHGAVTVVKAQQVGAYDVRVVRSDRLDALLEWLGDNGFAFEDADSRAFQDYTERGWHFVVAQVHSPENVWSRELISEGLVAPLIMRFPTPSPVYPLALTSLTGSRTKVLIYTLAEHKLTCSGRVPLRSAKDLGYGLSALADLGELLPSFTKGNGSGAHYLCKFRGVLTPEEMKEDLQFDRAAHDEPEKEWFIRW